MIKRQEDVTLAISEAKFGENRAPIIKVLQLTPELHKLTKIRETNMECLRNNKEIPKQSGLYELVKSTNLMTISHNKISKNDGVLSPGSTGETIEEFSMRKMEKLKEQLENKTFKWQNIKKIEIPRPGKNPRPLGIINHSEKIIQNNIRMILESIYEPIFENTNLSYGFRPHKSTKDCIIEISDPKNQGLQWVIEGDIKGAFDNVHPPTLAKILTKYIDDKEFINLIYEACITPTIKKDRGKKIIEPSPEGTPQGSILSPILFNIYMHEFDLQVIEILEKIKETYSYTDTKLIPTATKYNSITHYINKIRLENEKIEISKTRRPLTTEETEKIKSNNQKIDKLIEQRFKTPRIDYSRTKLRYFYNRYADDFLILLNKDEKICQEIKELISESLKNLKLTLSKEKTTITNLKTSKVNYLGFTLFMTKRYTYKDYTTPRKSRVNQQILVGIDINRTYNNLVKNGFAIEKTLEPTHKGSLAVLEDQEIIETYNSIIRGLYNYYYDIITYKSQLNRIHYILYYSALKTMACKHKSTTSKIYKKYGWKEINAKGKQTGKTRIVKQYKMTHVNQEGEENTKEYFAILINLHDINFISKDLIEKHKKLKEKTNKYAQITEDIWKQYKVNWRTKFKITKFCNICGSTEKLETHHIRKISGPTINKKDTFTQNIMRNLNRKQLVVCKKCHNKIHTGKYNGISLNDLYDIRTIKIENQLLTKYSTNNEYLEEQKTPKYTEYLIFDPNTHTVINLRSKTENQTPKM